MIKSIVCCVVAYCLVFTGNAQTKIPAMDKSPMDMSYYPVNYPILRVQKDSTEPLLARVVYSRPQKNGRKVFGELVEYGKIWRLGANEATEIEFYKDVKIGNNKIKKGRYTLYCIPSIDRWTVIINKETDIWGAFKYNIKKDIARIELPVQRQADAAESFSMAFEKVNGTVNLVMAWDEEVVKMPLVF